MGREDEETRTITGWLDTLDIIKGPQLISWDVRGARERETRKSATADVAKSQT